MAIWKIYFPTFLYKQQVFHFHVSEAKCNIIAHSTRADVCEYGVPKRTGMYIYIIVGDSGESSKTCRSPVS